VRQLLVSSDIVSSRVEPEIGRLLRRPAETSVLPHIFVALKNGNRPFKPVSNTPIASLPMANGSSINANRPRDG
jgi:hypothetical protein